MPPDLVAPKVISSTVLGLISWWLGSHTNLGSVSDMAIGKFKVEDLYSAWCALREAVQIAKGETYVVPTKHRSEKKLAEELVKEVNENDKEDIVKLLVPSSELGIIKVRIGACAGDDKAVSARLETLEDMMKNVISKLTVIESSHNNATVQNSNSPPVESAAQLQVPTTGDPKPASSQQQPDFAAVVAAGLGLGLAQHPACRHPLHNKVRRNSVKRSVSGAIRDSEGNTEEVSEDVFTDVVRKKKRKDVSKGTSNLQSIPGVEMPLQASYQHFVGNTPGNMEKETLETVLKELSLEVMKERGIDGALEIEACNLLTKEQNTRTRVWRVVVPDKY